MKSRSSLTGFQPDPSSKTHRDRWPKAGFSSIDALALVGVLALIGTVLVPAIAASRTQSLRAGCANNLRQVGYGFRAWAADHGDRIPPLLPRTQGGTGFHPLAPNAWLHYAWISNELRTPKVLTCPADENTRQARDFSDSPAGGFVHSDFRNKALSYFLTHSGLDFPKDLLAGDREFRGIPLGSCSSFISAARVESTSPDLGWTNIIHGAGGNALLNDGSVEQFSNSRAQQFFRENLPATSAIHFVRPR